MLDEPALPEADDPLPIDEPEDELPLKPAEPEPLVPAEPELLMPLELPPLLLMPELLLPLRPEDPLVEGEDVEAEPEPDAAVFSFG